MKVSRQINLCTQNYISLWNTGYLLKNEYHHSHSAITNKGVKYSHNHSGNLQLQERPSIQWQPLSFSLLSLLLYKEWNAWQSLWKQKTVLILKVAESAWVQIFCPDLCYYYIYAHKIWHDHMYVVPIRVNSGAKSNQTMNTQPKCTRCSDKQCKREK